jgi:hypothetical protein
MAEKALTAVIRPKQLHRNAHEAGLPLAPPRGLPVNLSDDEDSRYVNLPCSNDIPRWWTRLGSNQRPPRCQRGALPLSYASFEETYRQSAFLTQVDLQLWIASRSHASMRSEILRTSATDRREGGSTNEVE